MSDVDNAAGASSSEDNAVSVLDLDTELESNEVHHSEPAAAEAKTEEQAEDTAEQKPAETDETTSEATEEPEERLRDGSAVSKREMKEAVEWKREYQRHQRELEAKQAEYQQQVTQFRSQEQFVSQVLPLAIQLATKNLPPEPDPSELQTDPIGYIQRKEMRQAAVAELQSLHAAHQQQSQQYEQQRSQSLQSYVQSEQQKLYQAMPELSDVKKRQEFANEVLQTARHYGFSDQETNQVYDHRLLKMAKDAAAYRKLQAEKVKVAEKVRDVPPVAAPARRPTASTREGQARRDQLNRLSKSGRASDAEAFLSRFD